MVLIFPSSLRVMFIINRHKNYYNTNKFPWKRCVIDGNLHLSPSLVQGHYNAQSSGT